MHFYKWGQSELSGQLSLGLPDQYPEVKVFVGNQMPNAAVLCIAAISKEVKTHYRRDSPCTDRHTNICKQKNPPERHCPNDTFGKHLA